MPTKTPPHKARDFPVGARKRGEDKRLYAVTTDKNGAKRWKYAPPTKKFHQGSESPVGLVGQVPVMDVLLPRLTGDALTSLGKTSKRYNASVKKYKRENVAIASRVQHLRVGAAVEIDYAINDSLEEVLRITRRGTTLSVATSRFIVHTDGQRLVSVQMGGDWPMRECPLTNVSQAAHTAIARVPRQFAGLFLDQSFMPKPHANMPSLPAYRSLVKRTEATLRKECGGGTNKRKRGE